MKRIFSILIASVLLIITVVMSFKIYSLLIDEKEKDNPVTLTAGAITYELRGSLIDEPLYPGINIVDSENPFKLKSNSTIVTEIRIKISFYLNDILLDTNNYLENSDSYLANNWVYNSGDGFYYYQNSEGFISVSPNTEILVINTIILDGHYVKNHHSNEAFKVKITVEAKQKDHVNWSELT